MPIDKSKYPSNWKQIATGIKEKAKWKCQECGRPCRKPGVTWLDFIEELAGDKWHKETFDEVSDDSGLSTCVERPQRFTLTVAHLDHNPSNNHPDNLKALCSGCHLRYDAAQHAKNASATRYRKRERQGQLNLFDLRIQLDLLGNDEPVIAG
jgi:5-methylcytosine-specific restriction endonuclease McrA